VYAKGNLNYSDQANLTPFAYSQVSIGVKLSLTDGGVNDSKSKEKEFELKVLKEEYQDSLKLVKISKIDYKNKLDNLTMHIKNLEAERKIVQKTYSLQH
jgi:hypothetical protein